MILTYENGKPVKGPINSSLRALEIVNGTILHLENEASIPIIEAGPPVGPMPLPDLVPQKSTEETEIQNKVQYIRKCTHGPGTRCINCFASEKPEEKKVEDSTWLCRHGPEAK